MEYKLTKELTQRFEQFVNARGRTVATATTADKVLWLQTVADDRSIKYQRFYQLSRALEKYGSQSKHEKTEQAAIVGAYVSELNKAGRLEPMEASARAMTSRDFKRILEVLADPTNWKIPRVAEILLTMLLVMWFTGLAVDEIRRVRRSWIAPTKGGLVIRYVGARSHRTRDLLLPRRSDKYCPVKRLRKWLSGLPGDPEALVFPRHDREGNLKSNQRQESHALTYHFRRALELAGVDSSYRFISVRKSFLKRARRAVGLPVTFYLSGYRRPEILFKALRNEPDWSQAKSLF